jgi:histidine triad (HIT) family protein
VGTATAAFPHRPALAAAPSPTVAADPDCVFCQILAGTREATFVYRDEVCAAFGSIEPVQPGHVLLVPRHHAVTLYDLPESAGARLLPIASRIARALRDALHADGMTLLQNSGKAAGQTVPHFHLHLVPRREGVEVLRRVVETHKATQAELEGVLAPVRAALRGGAPGGTPR